MNNPPTGSFSEEITNPAWGLGDAALAFARAAANGTAYYPQALIKRLGKRPPKDAVELRLLVADMQKAPGDAQKFYFSGNALVWACVPSRKTEPAPRGDGRDIASTRISLDLGSNKITITSGSREAVRRRLKAAQGKNVPPAWKAAQLAVEAMP